MNNVRAEHPVKPRELYRYKRAAYDVLMIALFRNKMNPAVLKSIDAGEAVNAIVTLLICAHQAEHKQPANGQTRHNPKRASAAYRQHRTPSAAPKSKKANAGEGASTVVHDEEAGAPPK